jgi:hypothetical protein
MNLRTAGLAFGRLAPRCPAAASSGAERSIKHSRRISTKLLRKNGTDDTVLLRRGSTGFASASRGTSMRRFDDATQRRCDDATEKPSQAFEIAQNDDGD